MERHFGFPFGGFGHPTFFNPFFNPFFFPRRRFFPFFFFSPFFPFFRGEEDRDGTFFMHHQCKEGETLESLAQAYNVPRPVLEVTNSHIQNLTVIAPGSIVYIPRMDKMYCHKMYLEQEVPAAGTASAMSPVDPAGHMYQWQPRAPYGEYPYPVQQTVPYSGQ